MFPAFLTTIFFSLSAISGSRCARVFGGLEACFWRLFIATILLGSYIFLAGQTVPSAAGSLFMISGVVGVGIGDMLFFQALPRIGSRLTVLIIQTLSIPVAASIEWMWLGSKLSGGQIFSNILVIGGIALALTPIHQGHVDRRQKIHGFLFAIAAAFGNGLGAVLSRRAYQFAAQHSIEITGSAAAFSRVFGGVLIGTVFLLVAKRKAVVTFFNGSEIFCSKDYKTKWRKTWPWVMTTSLCGQTLGVTCFQWALKNNPTGVVLPILATTPLVTIPLARVIENERISLRATIGALIAVCGIILLIKL
jgi:drug/metabolite transporter (DMT)-like permease